MYDPAFRTPDALLDAYHTLTEWSAAIASTGATVAVVQRFGVEARVERDGRLIARLKPGDSFGEMSLIDGEPRSATVTADGPVNVLVVDPRAFLALLDDIPGLSRKVMAALCERLRNADIQLASRN